MSTTTETRQAVLEAKPTTAQMQPGRLDGTLDAHASTAGLVYEIPSPLGNKP